MSTTLDHLFDRNVAWVDGKTRADPDYFRRMAEQQAPEFLWIGRSDSRVTANDVLGLDPGAVFVHWNIANIVHTSDLNILSVLEFAIEHLKVRHVIVCGHYGCGGVHRAMIEERGAMLDHWLQPLTMLYRKHRPRFDRLERPEQRLDRLCEINIEMQVRRLAASPLVENARLPCGNACRREASSKAAIAFPPAGERGQQTGEGEAIGQPGEGLRPEACQQEERDGFRAFRKPAEIEDALAGEIRRNQPLALRNHRESEKG